MALSSLSAESTSTNEEINKITREICQADELNENMVESHNQENQPNHQIVDDIDLDLTIEQHNDLSHSLIQNTNGQDQIFEFYDQSSNKSAALETSLKHSNSIGIKSVKSDNNIVQYSGSYQNNLVKMNENHMRQGSMDGSIFPVNIGQNKENDLEAVSNLYNKLLINNLHQHENAQTQQHSASSTNSSLSCKSSLSLTSTSSTQINENLTKNKISESHEDCDTFKVTNLMQIFKLFYVYKDSILRVKILIKLLPVRPYQPHHYQDFRQNRLRLPPRLQFHRLHLV